MSEWSPDARDLIAQARKQGPELLGPSPEQRARLRERLTPLWAAEAAKPAAPSGLRWKLATAVMIAGLSAWGVFYERSEPASERAAQQPVAASPSAAAAPLPTAAATACDPGAALGTPGACLPLEAAAAPASQAPRVPTPSSAAAPTRRASAPTRRCERGSVIEANGPAGAGLAAARQSDCARADQTSAAGGVAAARRSEAAPNGERDRHHAQAQDELAADTAARRSDCASTNQAHGPSVRACQQPSERALSPNDTFAAGPRARRVEPQAPRAERLPLKAAEERTPERSVDTDATPAPPSIDGELELLGAAQTALQKQRPSRALSLLQEHAFRFPAGSFVEERMAMQALALCALQRRHAAESVLANLEARGSRSQLLPRVRSQCGL